MTLFTYDNQKSMTSETGKYSLILKPTLKKNITLKISVKNQINKLI